MKDHEIAQVVNKLRDLANDFHGTGQLRGRIAELIVPLLKDAPAPLSTVENLLACKLCGADRSKEPCQSVMPCGMMGVTGPVPSIYRSQAK